MFSSAEHTFLSFPSRAAILGLCCVVSGVVGRDGTDRAGSLSARLVRVPAYEQCFSADLCNTTTRTVPSSFASSSSSSGRNAGLRVGKRDGDHLRGTKTRWLL